MADDITALVAELKRLDAAATPAPWREAEPDEYPWVIGPNDYRGHDTFTVLCDNPRDRGYGVISVPMSLTDYHAGNRAIIVAARNALPILLSALETAHIELGKLRVCLNCGRTKDATAPRERPLPECVGEEGLFACTFDATPLETIDFWRTKAVNAQRERDEARDRCAELEREAAALREAATGVLDFCRDPDNANESFERVGEMYQRATGQLRPGKFDLFTDTSSTENVARFEAWAAAEWKLRHDKLRAALAGVRKEGSDGQVS